MRDLRGTTYPRLMDPGRYTEIDHTADLGLDLDGPTPEAVLEAAQRGLIHVLFGEIPDLDADERRVVELAESDRAELLKAWCESLYEHLETDGFVTVECDVESADPDGFRAILRGARPPAETVARASELKAVTWHQLAFERSDGRWRARVIFDV